MGSARIPSNFPSQTVPFSQDVIVLNGEQDFTRVQDAVDQASDGDYIAIGPGTYDEDVTVDVANLTLEGVGRKSELNGQGTAPALDVTADGVTVADVAARTGTDAAGSTTSGVKGSGDDLTLTGILVPNSQNHGIEISAVTRLRIENINIENAINDGINLSGATEGTIDQALLRGNISRHGINIGTNVNEVTVAQPHVKTVAEDAINISNDRTTVTGLIANGPRNGVVVESDSARSVIAGHWIGFTNDRGIDVAGDECMIVGVTNTSNGDDDIRIQSAASDCQIRGQTGDGSITDNGTNTVVNPSGSGSNEIDWTEDGNSPATATGANSITYTLNTSWDRLTVFLLVNDQASDGSRVNLTIDGNSSTGDYDGHDYSTSGTGSDDLEGVIEMSAGDKKRQEISVNAEGSEAAIVVETATGSAQLERGRINASPFDGQISTLKFDRGVSTDWRVEVYGRDVPAP